jgi:hypothetical protein
MFTELNQKLKNHSWAGRETWNLGMRKPKVRGLIGRNMGAER